MNRKTKWSQRILALAMAAMMCCSVFPVGAFAETPLPQESMVVAEEQQTDETETDSGQTDASSPDPGADTEEAPVSSEVQNEECPEEEPHAEDAESMIEQPAQEAAQEPAEENERAAREEQIQKLTKQIKALRHEFYICADIEADAAMVQEKLRQAELAAQQERNEVKEDEYKRRSSRPDGARGASVFRGGY